MKTTFDNRHVESISQLKKDVENYFKTNNIAKTGNYKLYLKTLLLVSSLASTYYLLVFESLGIFANILLCIWLGLNIAFIGFNVMHDGAHGSYSKYKWINKMMGHSLNLLGGNVFLWEVKHNVLHHTYTNIEDEDEDIDILPVMRTNVNQEKKWFHKYQNWYWPIPYFITYFWWVYIRDFVKYFSGKIGKKEFPKMNTREHFIFWISKVVHFAIFIVIPLFFVSFVHWLTGFLIAMSVCGITLSVVFQLAHVMPDTAFPLPDKKTGKIDDNWFLHQLKTTANFAPKSKIISFFAGGLNFQIEHHLFSKISHVHYPKIREFVKEFCEKNNVKYIEYKNFLEAIQAHILQLKIVGNA